MKQEIETQAEKKSRHERMRIEIDQKSGFYYRGDVESLPKQKEPPAKIEESKEENLPDL